MSEQLPPFVRDRREVTLLELDCIARALGPVSMQMLGLPQVDQDAGSGRIGPRERCVWRRDGRRVTLRIVGDLYVGEVSKEPDPDKPDPRSNGHA